MIVFDDLTNPVDILTIVIEKELRHPYYTETVDLADKYMAYTTGKKMDEMLRKFARREDDVMFEQRVSITNHIIPAVYSQIRKMFNKVPRTNAIHFDYISKKKDDLDTALEVFKANKPLDSYLSNRFVELSFTDPNTFLVTDFEGTDGSTYAEPYPLEVYSENAIYFKEEKGILNYLIGQFTTTKTVIENNELTEVELKRFVYWDKDRAVVFQEILDTYEVENYTIIGDVYYEIIEPDPYMLKEIPVRRIGYELEQSSNGAYFVNPIESAEPYLQKTIKTVSEMDLTMSLHAFPQKLQYLPKCTAVGCREGQLIEGGGVCPVCQGTGTMAVATTTQDVITMKMPDTEEGANLTPINSLVAYLTPDVALIKFQKEYIEYLGVEIRKTIFQTDTYTQAEVSQTATESNLNMQGVYDTLYPFAVQYCDVKEGIVYDVAGIMDIEVDVKCWIDKDFKLLSIDDLLNMLTLVNNSGANGGVLESINEDIIFKLNEDRPDKIAEYQLRKYFEPFTDKSKEQAIAISSALDRNDNRRLLYENSGEIFKYIIYKHPFINKMSYDKQKEIVDGVIESYRHTDVNPILDVKE